MTIKIPRRPSHEVEPENDVAGIDSAVDNQMRPCEGDAILTLKEAADKIGYSVVTIRRWIKSGVLVAYRAHGKGGYRLLEADLLKIMIVNDNF